MTQRAFDEFALFSSQKLEQTKIFRLLKRIINELWGSERHGGSSISPSFSAVTKEMQWVGWDPNENDEVVGDMMGEDEMKMSWPRR